MWKMFWICVLFAANANVWAQGDVEPNDSLETASAIPLNETIQGSISAFKAEDVLDNNDYFRVVIPASGNLTIHQTNTPEGLPFQYIFYGQNNLDWPIHSTQTHLPASSARTLSLEPGTYFLRINGRLDETPRTYSLLLAYEPAPDSLVDMEGNDTHDTASAITLNATHTGHISHVRDNNEPDNHDWYAFAIEADGVVEVRVRHQPAGHGFQYQIYGAQELGSAMVTTQTALPEQTSRLVWLREGNYLIRIRGRGEQIGRTYQLHLAYSFTPSSGADQEPNGNAASASELLLNTTHVSHLSHVRPDHSIDNEDWYAFQIPADGQVEINISQTPAGHSFQYQIYGASMLDWPILSTETVLPGRTTKTLWLSEGQYFVRFMGRGEHIGRVYRFAMVYTEALVSGVENELNDDAANASALTLNQAHIGSISHVRDDNTPDNEDWYALSVPRNGKVEIAMTQQPAGQSFQYFLYGANEMDSAILQTQTVLPEESSNEVWLHSGDYFLRIYGRGEAIGRVYSFRLNYTPAPVSALDHEANDVPEFASAVSLNVLHGADISHVQDNNQPDDADWFSFTLPVDDTLTIHTEVEPPNSSFQYVIWTGDAVEALFSSVTVLPASYTREIDLPAGDYLIQFRGRGERVGRVYRFELETAQYTVVPHWFLH